MDTPPPLSPNASRSPITGAVLAGGQGSRMGGQDKGWILYQGTPLINHALNRLAPQVDRLLISANRNLDRYGALGIPVLPDRRPGFPGPLGGVEAALMATETPLLLTIPCDSPDFPPDLADQLGARMAPGVDAVVARSGGFRQPVFALYRTHLAGDLGRFLDEGGRAVGAWLDQLQTEWVEFADPAAFRNCNEPGSLEPASPSP